MLDNPRSEPTPEQIRRLLQEAVLTNYPNPERRGCPDQETLRAVAARTLPHQDPQWQHVTHCSPCYQDFLGYRATVLQGRRNRRRLTAAVAGAIAAAALVAALWVSLGRPAPKVSFDNARRAERPLVPGSPNGSAALTAVLNMQASPTRGAGGDRSGSGDLQRLPRSRVAPLLIYLPFGSDAGTYDVELLRDGKDSTPLAKFTGSADIRDGLTVLQISLDLSGYPAGTYVFSVSGKAGTPWICRFVLS